MGRNQKEIEGKKREGKGKKSQVLSQQQPLKEKELFDDEKMDTRIKKKQLESQARKRSKQQYQQNGRIGTENLEKIANNQDLYETNKKFGLKKDERIIDVEGYKLDNSTEKIVDEGVNEVRQKQYQKKQERNQKEIEGKKREG